MRRLAKPMLAGAALIWGSSFFMMKGVVDILPPLLLLALRFSGGAVLLGLVCWNKWRLFTPDYLWRGAVIGGFLCAAYGVQTFGIQYTTASNNAFLTAVYCVLVPFLCWAVMGRKPDRYNILAAVLCVAGVALVSVSGDFSIGLGDGLTLVGAFFYAAHIVAVEKVSQGGKDIYLLTVLQFAFAALYCWGGSLLLGRWAPLSAFTPQVLAQLVYLTVMCTTLALLFQNVGQIWSDPASASILLSLESVFGVIFSVLFCGDAVTARLLLGFVLIFIAVVCSETKFAFLRAPKTGAFPSGRGENGGRSKGRERAYRH